MTTSRILFVLFCLGSFTGCNGVQVVQPVDGGAPVGDSSLPGDGSIEADAAGPDTGSVDAGVDAAADPDGGTIEFPDTGVDAAPPVPMVSGTEACVRVHDAVVALGCDERLYVCRYSGLSEVPEASVAACEDSIEHAFLWGDTWNQCPRVYAATSECR